MENREVFRTPDLPKALSVLAIPEERRPTAEDWVAYQGGMPKIEWVNDMNVNVIHDYENKEDPTGTGAVVPTSTFIVESWRNPTFRVVINGRVVEIPTALSWDKHGKPCEKRSLANGGEGYQRIKVAVGK